MLNFFIYNFFNLSDTINMKKCIIIFIILISSFHLSFAQDTNRANTWIAFAKQYIGTPYLYGGMTKKGIDCSGFIHITAYEGIKLSLPRTTSALYDHVRIIADSQKMPGDLLFFNTVGSDISHVGLYMGNNQFIHAASSGPNTGVIVSSLSENYWGQSYRGVGRVLDENANNTEIIANTSAKQNQLVQNSKTPTKPTSTKLGKSQNIVKNYSKNETSFGFLYNDYFSFELGASLDWSAYNIPDVFLSTRGFTFHTLIETKKFQNNFGLGFDLNYDDFLSIFHIPVYLSLEINPQLKLYTGPVFSLGNAYIQDGDEKIEVKAPIYPLFFGISINSPLFSIFGIKGYVFQKINYTYYKAVTNEDLAFYNAYRASFVFKSGVQILL